MSTGEAVKVRREKIAACMTCPLCQKLLKAATTISLCLHTFCRKCIYDRFSDDEVETCPLCDINLGCNPVDKLRPDHNLQDIRAKIFPFKRRKVEAHEVSPPVTQPAKRKERSLSSLVVSTPRVSMQTGVTGKRTRARKSTSFRSSSPGGESFKRDDYSTDHTEGSSSPETLNKIVQNKKQTSGRISIDIETMENSNDRQEGKVDLWKPLNCLVEAVNRKFSKPSSQGQSNAKSVPSVGPDADTSASRTNVEENGHGPANDDDKNSNTSIRLIKRRRRRANGPYIASAESNGTPQLTLSTAQHVRKNAPIWFSLVASEDQKGSHPLPQVSAGFLRVKDGSMPVSIIQKYLVKKLELTSEANIQITCQGQVLLPTLQLRNILEQWLQKSPVAPNKLNTPVTMGESAKEFVMVLTYSRKTSQPAEGNN